MRGSNELAAATWVPVLIVVTGIVEVVAQHPLHDIHCCFTLCAEPLQPRKIG